MYTVLWTKNGMSRWERCDDRLAVVGLLNHEGIRDDPDVIVFGPDADDCIVPVEDIYAGI